MQGTQKRPGPLLLALLAGVLALAGGWQVARLAGADAPGLRTGGVTVEVLSTEQISGVTDADVGGMTHGVQDLVSADKALVEVSVRLSAGRHPGAYDLRALRLRVGTRLLEPAAASLLAGRLNPGARIEGSVAFVVPRTGTDLTLLAPDSGTRLPLGRVDLAPPDATAGHDHGGTQ